MDFGDRVVVVTGASSGIGECCARRLLELGAGVAGLDIRPSEISGEDFRAYPVDVADDSSVLAAADDIVQRFGRIDGLVNTAGISTNAKPFYEMTTEEFDRVISVNLRGTFVCSRYVSREMTRSKQWKIVNVSCVRSRIFGPNSADYSASKAGVVALTCAMALDLAPFGIQVNSVAPGATFTGMTQEYGEVALANIRQGHITQFVESLRGLKASTKRRKLNCLSSFFRYAVGRGHIDSNPVEGVTRPKVDQPLPVCGYHPRTSAASPRRQGGPVRALCC